MLIPKQKSNKDKNLVDCMICFKHMTKILMLCKLDLIYFFKQSLNLTIHLRMTERFLYFNYNDVLHVCKIYHLMKKIRKQKPFFHQDHKRYIFIFLKGIRL